MQFLNVPVETIIEDWTWKTDVQVATDGTELRVELYELPKRHFKLQYAMDDANELRQFAVNGAKVGSPFDCVLYQYATKLTANAALAAVTLHLANVRTDLRIGGKAYLFDRAGGEVVTIDGLTSTTATIHAGLSRAYTTQARLAPMANLYSSGTFTLDRLNPDYAALATVDFREIGFTNPFVNAYNTATLTTLGGLPVLERRAIGGDFPLTFDTGVDVIDYGGLVSLRNQWTHSKEVFARDFLCQRILAPADWDYWRVFADYAKGSCNPFLVPTYRGDFDIVHFDPLVRDTLKIGGSLYRTDYFPFKAYKQVAITTLGGTHFATVTAATDSSGDTVLTLSPALPSGTGWDNLETVSLLSKCRIADDRVSCEHAPLHTTVSLQLRTVDE